MLTKWNLVEGEKVTNNPSEIRLCDCFYILQSSILRRPILL